MENSIYLKHTASTNDFLRTLSKKENLSNGFVVYTDFQTAGKGQIGNTWESAKRKNALFSILLYPNHIAINQQFIISQLISVAIKNVLNRYLENITIKWPNDIYWNDKKIAGILIENAIQKDLIKNSIIGIGLNVNQLKFSSNIPNPVSMKKVTGKSFRRLDLIKEIKDEFIRLYSDHHFEKVKETYMKSLYRNDGFYPFSSDENTHFLAKIVDVKNDGKLVLLTDKNELEGFYFKEVNFII